MKRFIITEEEKKSILKMYGLIIENTNSLSLPHVVSNSWTAPDCDALHTFQSRQEDKKDERNNSVPDPNNPGQNQKESKVYGDMNALVTEKLVEFTNANIPVKVTDITITVSGMKVEYKVTIDKDPKGQGFNGFTSRGAGCGSLSGAKSRGFNTVKDYLNSRATTETGKSTNEIKSNIQSSYGNVLNFETVKTFYDDNIPDGNKFLQIFYQYKSQKNPNVKSQKTINAENQKNNQTNDNTINVNRGSIINYTTSEYTDLNELNKEFKTKVRNLITQNGNKNYLVKKFEITNSNYKCSATIILSETKEKGFNAFSVLFNPSGTPQTSLNNALSKNPGSEKIGKPKTINLKNSDGSTTSYECHLVGIPLNN
jgi:hypothetical protein